MDVGFGELCAVMTCEIRLLMNNFCHLDLVYITSSYSSWFPVLFQILWVFPFYWLQWLLVMLGMALSGTVLIFTLWPSIRHDKKQVNSLPW